MARTLWVSLNSLDFIISTTLLILWQHYPTILAKLSNIIFQRTYDLDFRIIYKIIYPLPPPYRSFHLSGFGLIWEGGWIKGGRTRDEGRRDPQMLSTVLLMGYPARDQRIGEMIDGEHPPRSTVAATSRNGRPSLFDAAQNALTVAYSYCPLWLLQKGFFER